ncbi:MAG: LacI family transcriptional regulator [Halanaerobiales bacterium]|nr:LacI family transcriptional regulator [Halanaerobiales bacterium]
MPLTLKDIARMVGVAESTVSRAINNKPGVGEETRRKIMKIVKEYNFKPNQLARGLAKKETRIIALLLSDLATPGYTEIIKSIEEVANRAGYQVILCNTANDIDKEKAYLELVARNRVDGAIIVGGELADKNILNLALNKEGRLVLVNRLAEEVLIPTILVDNAKGGYLATAHLIEQGLSRIAIIMGSIQDFLESEKLNGYKQALKDHNLPLREELIFETDGSRESGYNTFLNLMELDEPPGGFFVTSDLLAVGLIEAIKMGGYFIPDDFAIVSYGESLITSIINPPLTVVAEPLNKLGRLAAEYLLKLINNQSPDRVIRVLEPVLKMRASSNPQIKS